MKSKVTLLVILVVAAVAVNAYFMKEDKNKHSYAVKPHTVLKGSKVCDAQERFFRAQIGEINTSIKNGRVDEVMNKHVRCADCLDKLIRNRLKKISEKEVRFTNVEMFKIEDCAEAKIIRYWDVKCKVAASGEVTFRYIVENRKPRLINVL